MFDLLKKRLFGGAPAAPTLAARLAHYPPHQMPHAGWGRQLSVEAARENLAYFESVLPQRLALLGQLLSESAGIDTAPGLQSPHEHGASLTQALSAWAGQTWPGLVELQPAISDGWYDSSRAGPDIALSLALDVAMLLGEVIRRGNPDWRWDVDLDRTNLRDQMVTARRVVLLADPVGEMKHPFVIDVEDIVVGRLRQPQSTLYGHAGLDPWQRMVTEGLRGDDMAFWRTAQR